MEKRFALRGVTRTNLEHYLGHPLSLITDDEIADLFGVYTAIKEGASTTEFFIDDNSAQDETAQRLETAIAQNSQPEKPAKATKPRQKKDKPQDAAPAQQETEPVAAQDAPRHRTR